MSWDDLLPLAILPLGLAIGFLADRLSRLRRPDGERGDFWARTLQRLCLLLAPALLVSGALQTLFPQVWNDGYHLHFDLTTVRGWSFPTCYRLALALPLALWLMLLAVALIEKPGGREAGRWLAGAVGFGKSRRWVLLCALPLALLLAFKWNDLHRDATGYPAAGWSMMAMVLLCLLGIAWSAGRIDSETRPPVPAAAAAAGSLRPWPQALEAHGVELRQLASWPAATAAARAVRGPAAGDLASRLEHMEARGVAPELVEAVDGLLHPHHSAEPDELTRLVFAPDDCGQTECVALAATLLEQRFHATTLVITAGGARALAERLERWSPAGRVVTVSSAAEVPRDALVWVVDAERLSDRMLPRLRDTALVGRVGLVVWWHLEAYTGVLGANLWAISRRLHRLITVQGRHDVRTLALVRSAPHSGAQMGDFVRRLLPHRFPSHTEVHVETRFPHAVELHQLESHRRHFARGEGRNLKEGSRHPLLVAAGVSVEEGWPSYLEPPDDVTGSEIEAFLQRPSGDGVVAERLIATPASAGVRLRGLRAADTLSLVEIVSQGGRRVTADTIHHVGVAAPWNPYARHLLQSLAGGGAGFQTSRRLVCAEAHPSIIRRHLHLALNELPDTRRGLLRNFLWNEEVIRRTLDQISHENKLVEKEVRYLDEEGRLKVDREYRSRRPPSGERRPLDTIGVQLIGVRNPAESDDEGIRMRVDLERLTIQAYPNRVFLARGRRYRIQPWDSPEEIRDRGWLPCRQEAVYSHTWRIRNPYVFDFEPREAPAGIGRRGRLLTRLTVDLHYEEEVAGAIRLAPDLTTGQLPKPETLRLAQPITQSFPTRALILSFPEPEELIALSSLSQALRHVLPVHLGIEEDALEVVPLYDEEIGNTIAFGVAIVDLYPGGIGLIDAIHDDNTLILQLLEWTRDWLQGCACQKAHGCERCLRSPAALAANSGQPPQRSAALRLLGQIV